MCRCLLTFARVYHISNVFICAFTYHATWHAVLSFISPMSCIFSLVLSSPPVYFSLSLSLYLPVQEPRKKHRLLNRDHRRDGRGTNDGRLRGTDVVRSCLLGHRRIHCHRASHRVCTSLRRSTSAAGFLQRPHVKVCLVPDGMSCWPMLFTVLLCEKEYVGRTRQ